MSNAAHFGNDCPIAGCDGVLNGKEEEGGSLVCDKRGHRIVDKDAPTPVGRGEGEKG